MSKQFILKRVDDRVQKLEDTWNNHVISLILKQFATNPVLCDRGKRFLSKAAITRRIQERWNIVPDEQLEIVNRSYRASNKSCVACFCDFSFMGHSELDNNRRSSELRSVQINLEKEGGEWKIGTISIGVLHSRKKKDAPDAQGAT